MIMIMMKKQQPWMMMMMFSKQVFSMINSSSSSSSSSSCISLINSTVLLLGRRPLCSSTATTNTSCLSSVTQPPTVSNNTSELHQREKEKLNILLEKKHPLLIVPYNFASRLRCSEDVAVVYIGSLGFINLFHDDDHNDDDDRHELIIFNRKKKNIKKKKTKKGDAVVYLREMLNRRICGSSEGWLVTVHENGEFQLINPVTRVIVHLPPFTAFPEQYRPCLPNVKKKKNIRDNFIYKLVNVKKKNIRDINFIRKAVTNTTNSTTLLQPTVVVVMAIYEYYGGLAFCRTSLSTGNGIVEPAAWIKIPVKTPMSAGLLTQALLNSRDAKKIDNDITFEIIDGVTYWCTINFGWLVDVTFYQGNFYVVSSKGAVGVVKGLDNSSPFVQFLIDVPKGLGSSKYKYLVESSSSSSSGGGDLLMIIRYIENVAEPGTKTEEEEVEEEEEEFTFKRPYRTTAFGVVKLNLNNGLSPSWEEVTDLGEDCALFIGYNHSFSFSASKIPGCRGNCIYFTDNNVEKTDYFWHGGHDIGVYNLEDDSFEKLNYETWSDQLSMPPPVWYQA